jgi:iron complex outermembrane recepter protein
MSELIHINNKSKNMRRHLLASASALALIGSTYGIAYADSAQSDGDHPAVWIELGGQFEQVETQQDAFVPPFSLMQPEISPMLPGNVQLAPGSVQKPLDYSFGAEGKILFEPDGTDWVFAAGIRYGRSSSTQHTHRGTAPHTILLQYGSYKKYQSFPASQGKFSDAQTRKTEQHMILDFEAGKDVGLGMFGRNGSSLVSVGVRIAQFNSGLNATLGSGPDPFQYNYYGPLKFPTFEPHTFLGHIQAKRSFQGLGPSLSWNASAAVAGSAETSELTIDWGVNAALLFGRQKAKTQHQTTAFYKPGARHGNPQNLQFTVYQHGPYPSTRLRTVTVPNIGGFAGVSLKFPNAKVSLGYRADFFFGAMDGGIDAARKENVGFYGPFATISVGIGG